MPLTSILAEMSPDGTVTAELVLKMRRDVFKNGVVDAREADALFDLDGKARHVSPEWTHFFIEALVDYLVNQEDPVGYVSDDNADWLIERITRDGRVEGATELELLIRVLENARHAPERLATLALTSIANAVTGDAAGTRDARTASVGRVDAAEVERIRRVLFAAGGETGLAVSRGEAEILFAIDRAVAGADNAPEWNDLFARAIANHLLSASVHAAPSRAEAMRRQQWLNTPTAGVGAMLGRIFGSIGSRATVSGLGGALSDPLEAAYALENAHDDLTLAQAADLTQDEAQWLVDSLAADGRLTAAEARLKDFLAAETGTLPAPVRAVVEKLAKAA
jgi:hypothetical protein